MTTPTALDFSAVEAISFDCFGTLIDWETGMLDALRPGFRRHGVAVSAADILTRFARIEPRLQSGVFRPYREVLRSAVHELGAAYGFAPAAAEADCLADSLPAWPPFPDTIAALRLLKKRYRLAVVSNIDDDLLAGIVAQLESPFEVIVTAQQVGSYKPARGHFDALGKRLQLPVPRILHAAQSRFHDIAPARALGFSTVWVNRQATHGASATPEANATADLAVSNLAALVRRAGLD